MLLYGLEACRLNVTDTWSIDFVINRCFHKLFKTSDMEVVKYCQIILKFEMPSVLLST